MKQFGAAFFLAVALLAGCKKADPAGGRAAYDVAEEAPAAEAAGGSAGAIKVAIPQIAYSYSFSYELPEDRIAKVQADHIVLCDRLGLAHCHVLSMKNGTSGGEATDSALKLSVDARMARSFSTKLAAIVGGEGGKQDESSITAEDLSKQVVDTEAHLRAKQVLADRLMTLLKTRNGPVADLVAAERSVSEVQEEIDTAQSWLAEARGRVDMSSIEISYRSGGMATGFFAPLSKSVTTMGGFLGRSLSVIITGLAILLPWVLLIGGGVMLVRYLRRRLNSDGE
jgi:hypothetical protein